VIWLQGELARGNQPEFVVEPTDMASPGKRLKKGIFVIIKNIGWMKKKKKNKWWPGWHAYG
jgi:hypothetical protein